MKFNFLWTFAVIAFFLLPNNFVDAASPNIASVTEKTFTTDVTNHAVNMPASVTAGDLLLVVITTDGNAAVTTPTGWNELWNTTTGTALRAGGYAKIAVGNEGGTTVNFVTTSIEQAAAQVYQIQNWYGTLDGLAVGNSVISASDTTANPPALSPNWGTADTLWIPVVHTSTGRTITSGPTGYSNLISTRSGDTTASGQIASARLSKNTASEDPGVFTFSSTGVTSVAQTIAIAPANTTLTKTLEHFTVTQPNNSTELWVPVYTSQPYQTSDPNVKRAVIVIHGTNNNAVDYFDFAANAVSGTAGIVVLAPQFAEIENNPELNQLFWSSGWRECNRSDASLPWRISSCEIIDRMISSLYTTFPNLDNVVIAGFSAGGQFVNRYAAASNDSRNIYIVGSPSSYLYFSNLRPDGNGNFTVPTTTCATYNDYKFGLDNLSVTSYVNQIGATELTNRYGQAKITYLVGSNDNDPNGLYLDTTCEAQLQGDQRLSRMQNFYNFLGLQYGTSIYNLQKMEVVSGFGHDAKNIFGSEQGKNAFLQGFNTNTITSTSTNITTYTLSFNTQGGSSVSDVILNAGSNTLLPTAPTLSGYTFKNWNTLAAGDGIAYLAGTSYIMPSNNTTLYAIWSQNITTRGGKKNRLYSSMITTSLTPRDLTKGLSGEDVGLLQELLIEQGQQIPAGATGYFGSQTQSALASYQSKNNIIPASGYFGPITREHMKVTGSEQLWW